LKSNITHHDQIQKNPPLQGGAPRQNHEINLSEIEPQKLENASVLLHKTSISEGYEAPATPNRTQRLKSFKIIGIENLKLVSSLKPTCEEGSSKPNQNSEILSPLSVKEIEPSISFKNLKVAGSIGSVRGNVLQVDVPLKRFSTSSQMSPPENLPATTTEVVQTQSPRPSMHSMSISSSTTNLNRIGIPLESFHISSPHKKSSFGSDELKSAHTLLLPTPITKSVSIKGLDKFKITESSKDPPKPANSVINGSKSFSSLSEFPKSNEVKVTQGTGNDIIRNRSCTTGSERANARRSHRKLN
jgi:hypothetical protein